MNNSFPPGTHVMAHSDPHVWVVVGEISYHGRSHDSLVAIARVDCDNDLRTVHTAQIWESKLFRVANEDNG